MVLYPHFRTSNGDTRPLGKETATLFSVASLSVKAATKPKVFIMSPKEKSKNKVDRLRVRVTENELIFFKAKASSAGLTLAEYTRQSLTDCVIIKNDSEADKRLTYQLSSLGNNLNQLSKRANIHGILAPDDYARFNDLIVTISSLLKERV